MEETPERLILHKRIQVSQSLSITYFDKQNPPGDGQVAVFFEQKLGVGMKQEFRTDMHQLASVVRGAKNFQNGPERFDSVETIGDCQVRYTWYQSDDQGRGVLVKLKPEDLTRNTAYVVSKERLQIALEEGESVERELGYGPKYHQVIARSSLTRGEGEKVEAIVVASFENILDAQKLVKENSGVALSPEKSRRLLVKDDTVELSIHTSIEVKGGLSRTVNEELESTARNKSRITENFVLTQWNDQKQMPVSGRFAERTGNGVDYNDKIQDYLSNPYNSSTKGEPQVPIYAILRRTDGCIEAWSHSREDLKRMLPVLEAAHKEQQRQEQSGHAQDAKAEQKANQENTDLAKRSFGPRRKL